MLAETAQTFRRTELPGVESIFGNTPGMREIRMKIEDASRDILPVLIEGESGTGKEVVGRFLHHQSDRREGPFLRVNCGAVPARLLESEMFGHDVEATSNLEGSKKGAIGKGSIGLAAGGSLFLDEVGDLDLRLQRRILATIEAGEYGDRNGRKGAAFDARFVCASSRDLQPGPQFLEEFLQCFVHRVRLKPLRERKQDIPQLCEFLVEKFARNFGRPVPQLSPYVLRMFEEWNWPGNIRELENWIARIVIFGTEEVIGLEFRRQLGIYAEAPVREHRATRPKLDRPRRIRRHD